MQKLLKISYMVSKYTYLVIIKFKLSRYVFTNSKVSILLGITRLSLHKWSWFGFLGPCWSYYGCWRRIWFRNPRWTCRKIADAGKNCTIRMRSRRSCWVIYQLYFSLEYFGWNTNFLRTSYRNTSYILHSMSTVWRTKG